MAKLDELRKRMYSPKETFEERMREPGLTSSERGDVGLWREATPLPAASRFRKWIPKIIIGAVVLILASVLMFFIFAPGAFFETQKIIIEINGQQEIQSGDRVVWTVEINNNNDSAIESAALVFNYPEGAMSADAFKTEAVARDKRTIGVIQPRETVTETFDAYVFGGTTEKRAVSALFEFRQQGSSITQAKTSEFQFIIARSPVSLSLEIPKELRIGQQVVLRAHYTSQSEIILQNSGLNFTFPDGFEVLSSRPAPFVTTSNEMTWKIGDLAPSQSGTIEIEARIKGSDLDSKSFSGAFGVFGKDQKKIAQVYDRVTAATVLRSPFLDVRIETPITASPGDEVSVNAYWRNNLPVEIRNPTLSIIGSGDAIDLLSLRPILGSFKDNAMIWNAASYAPFRLIPPGGSGVIKFDFDVKNNLARAPTASRPVVNFQASFYSTGPVAGFEGVDVNGFDKSQIKIATKLTFTAGGLYFNSAIPNTGPLPPTIGAETTYTIVWSLANMSNDVDGVIVQSSLPPYIAFKNVINPADEDIRFEEQSGFVTWKAGKVQAGTGFMRAARQVAFQVGLRPLPIHIGDFPVLARAATAIGTDTFTGKKFKLSAPEITTALQFDKSISAEQYKVLR